jgi:hypothetical protein
MRGNVFKRALAQNTLIPAKMALTVKIMVQIGIFLQGTFSISSKRIE